jgi:hypothetical protein
MDMTHDIPQQLNMFVKKKKTGLQKCYVEAIKQFWPCAPTSINCIYTLAAFQQRRPSVRHYTASNGRNISERWLRKEVEGSAGSPLFAFSRHYWGETEKEHENAVRSAGKDLNPGPHEYEVQGVFRAGHI